MAFYAIRTPQVARRAYISNLHLVREASVVEFQEHLILNVSLATASQPRACEGPAKPAIETFDALEQLSQHSTRSSLVDVVFF